MTLKEFLTIWNSLKVVMIYDSMCESSDDYLYNGELYYGMDVDEFNEKNENKYAKKYTKEEFDEIMNADVDGIYDSCDEYFYFHDLEISINLKVYKRI